jgi:hypothetical protein
MEERIRKILPSPQQNPILIVTFVKVLKYSPKFEPITKSENQAMTSAFTTRTSNVRIAVS